MKTSTKSVYRLFVALIFVALGSCSVAYSGDGHSLKVTATAYNSGPAPVARWFRKNPDASFPWLVEEFEYNEGRAYGRKVAEHMLRYLYLYEPSAEVRGQILDKMFPLDRTIDIPDDVGY